jgi:cyclomaltodextrinase / maltogenic alpha-amylase / neopullulanase
MMASSTDISLRSQLIYQVFVRQHSTSGDFEGVIRDLDRIKDLGTDILYLMPIHPIGIKDRKGDIGSPYAIMDHMAIDPAYGTDADFDRLVRETRARGMRLMIDIVINHTSRDSVLTKQHPDWFFRRSDGTFSNRVGDWSDITDLDYSVPGVREYFKEVLLHWARRVDGFRCDVAPMVPMDFWRDVRNAVDAFAPSFIWLSESVHLSFVKYLRDNGVACASDSEIFGVFDIAYDYDIFDHMDAYLKDPAHLPRWLEEIMRQESVYPENYVKLRSFENHDQDRLRHKVKDDCHFKNMLAMSFFIKGATMVYAGMEHMSSHKPDLFTDDKVKWDASRSISPLIKTLSKLKKETALVKGVFEHLPQDNAAVFRYRLDDEVVVGVFNLEGASGITTGLKDGIYRDILGSGDVRVMDGHLAGINVPVVLAARKDDMA